MNPVLQAIHARRSIRRFKSQPVDRQQLEQVVEAGRQAPTGGNTRTTRFVVIQNPQILERIQETACGAFAQMEADENTYKSLRHSIQASKKGGYRFLYEAPVLILTTNLRNYGNAYSDCACALENMMLAAHSLGLGSCWINQLHWLDDAPPVRAYLEALGLDPGETVCGGLALGWPDQSPAPIEHTGNRVDWIDADVELPG